MSQDVADRLARMLQLADLFEPLNVTGEEGKITLFGRVRKERRDRWEKFLLSLFGWQQQSEVCEAHICQRYLVKEGRLAYGWSIGLSSTRMNEMLAGLSAILQIYDPSSTVSKPKAPAPTPPSGTADAVPLRKVSQTVLPSGEVITIETDPLPGAYKERVPNENGKGGYLIGSRDGNKNFRPPRRG